MATLGEITAAMRNAFARRNAGDVSLKLDFKEEGCIYIRGATVTNEDAPANCTITMTKQDFEDVLTGELDARQAMIDGALVVEGDLGVASRMQEIIASAWT